MSQLPATAQIPEFASVCALNELYIKNKKNRTLTTMKRLVYACTNYQRARNAIEKPSRFPPQGELLATERERATSSICNERPACDRNKAFFFFNSAFHC